MSSNSINYNDEEIFQIDDVLFSIGENDFSSLITDNDYNGLIENIPDVAGNVVGIIISKKNVNDMDRDELLDYVKNDKMKKRQYISKYQKTDKGKIKTRQASKKYYDGNRERILLKKRIAYQNKRDEKKVLN
jgi:hypothetical protein